MTSDAILAELRGLPGAPDTLRERVLALPEPQPRISWSLPRLDLRRFALVAAPAVLPGPRRRRIARPTCWWIIARVRGDRPHAAGVDPGALTRSRTWRRRIRRERRGEPADVEGAPAVVDATGQVRGVAARAGRRRPACERDDTGDAERSGVRPLQY